MDWHWFKYGLTLLTSSILFIVYNNLCLSQCFNFQWKPMVSTKSLETKSVLELLDRSSPLSTNATKNSPSKSKSRHQKIHNFITNQKSCKFWTAMAALTREESLRLALAYIGIRVFYRRWWECDGDESIGKLFGIALQTVRQILSS